MSKTNDVDVIVDEIIAEEVDAGQARGTTDVVASIQALNNPDSGFYSSITSTDFASRLKVASALTTSKALDDHLGQTIKLVNFIVQPVDLADDNGTVETAPRVVLIDAEGNAFHATSVGLLSSLKNIVSALGAPETWEHPIGISVARQKGNNGYSFFTIKFV